MGRHSRPLRSTLLTLLLATLLVVGVGPAPATAPVHASSEAGKDGRCTDASGVTVVIDFQELGGGIVMRCAGWPLPGNGTGLDALNAAGIPVDGVRRWGLGFICRIYDRPSASESVPVKNQTDYTEACIDTPPSAAYWSYWHSPNGGSWTYSQYGVKNRVVPEGSYEGWSFSLNKTAQTNPIPRVAPKHRYSGTRTSTPTRRPAAPGGGGSDPLAPEPGSGLPGDPLATSGGGNGGGGSGGGSGSSGDRSSASTTQPGQDQQQTRAGQPEASSTSGPTSTPSSTSTSRAAGSSRSSSSSGAATSGDSTNREDLVVDSDELRAEQQRESEDAGPSWPLFGGLALIAFIVVMAIGTALRRRPTS